MRIQGQLYFLVSSFILLFGFEILLSSCASRSAPSGGPQDTLAPVLDTAFPPNMSTNFTEKEITLVFNEYIQLKSAAQQISFSPPLKNKPTITNKGKELIINWERDTLLDSTTYIISFGTAIADFTEGNVNEKIKYVFSTGDYIDSLSLGGVVMSAGNSEPVADIMVALYDLATLKSMDSIPFKNIPTYYAYTSENGTFSLSNMKYADFHVVAFEDKRGNFKMTTGTEKVAFLKDTVSTSLDMEPLKLVAFDPASADRFYGARQVEQGNIQLAFNYSVPGLEVSFLDTGISDEFHFLSLNENKDTANFWFKQNERDTIALLLKSNGEILDTAVASLSDLEGSPFTLQPIREEVKYTEPVLLKASSPVKTVYDSLILVYTNTDTLNVTAEPGKDNPLIVSLQPSKRLDDYTIFLKKGAVENIFGEKNDSLTFDIITLKKEDLGNLDFRVTADTTFPLVLQISNPDKEKIIDTSFTGSILLKLRNMESGIYEINLIIDENGDGKWTTGDYLERRQPERIIRYAEEAEIRANWDLELEWLPDIPRPQSVNLKGSRSDKN